MSWWSELGYPDFDAGEDGNPLPGQVIREFRLRKKKQNGESWTQNDLAKALGDMSARSVINMERGVGMDSYERRKELSRILDIPTLLLGLSPPPLPAAPPRCPSPSPSQAVDLEQVKAKLPLYWAEDTARPARMRIQEITAILSELSSSLHYMSARSQTVELLCRYHLLISWIYRDLRKFKNALAHVQRAFDLRPNKELLADALYRRAGINASQRQYMLALTDYQAAYALRDSLPAALRLAIQLQLGETFIKLSQTPEERYTGIELMDEAGKRIDRSLREGDEHFLRLDSSLYHLLKGEALTAVGYYIDAQQELELIQRRPEFLRRAILADILMASSKTYQGEYEQALALAESALLLVKDLRSSLNYERLVAFYYQIKATAFGGDPEVERFRFLLYRKPHS